MLRGSTYFIAGVWKNPFTQNSEYVRGFIMSFFLDPLVLLLLGWGVFFIERKWRMDGKTVVFIAYLISAIFIGASTLLYLDVIAWPIPHTPGALFMFHTRITGILKEDIHLGWAIFMFALYPFWLGLGYLVGYRREFGAFRLKTVTYRDVRSEKDYRTSRVEVRREIDSPGITPAQMTKEAVEALGGMKEFVSPGDRVIIKPNICGGNSIYKGTYTKIEIVDQLVRMIRELEATPVIVDADMIWTRFEPIAKAEGWIDWAKANNVTLLNLSDTKKCLFDFGAGSATVKVPVSREMVDADVIISVPVMKTHLLTSVTLGMKNMYGTFTEENKARYHRYGIEEVIYDVNRAFTPNLTIVDGTIGGEGFGPLSCTDVEFGTIIASNDVVAADAVTCKLMGYDPFDIDHIAKAHKRGLGNAEIDLAELNITPHPKDGDWKKPDDRVSTFYEQLVEHFLLIPGVGNLFDIGADLVLRDAARAPFLRNITPQVEEFLDGLLTTLFDWGHRKESWGEAESQEFLDKLEERKKSRPDQRK